MSDDKYGRNWKTEGDFGQHFDPGSFNFARSFRRHGGMKFYVLWLLSRKPMKGSEIISEAQEQTMGWWRPSPGTVYPLLSSMEKAGLIRRLEDNRYELTDLGAEEIGLRPGEAADRKGEGWDTDKILTDLEGYVSYLEEEPEGLSDFSDRVADLIERLKKLHMKG